MLKKITNSDEETQNIAYEFSKQLKGGEILCLYGDLGAGKTCFTKGIAKGLNSTSYVSSPTFTIINEYNGTIPIYHFDLYRIDTDGFLEIGGDEYFYKNGIVILEWPENIKEILPKERIEITIKNIGEEKREIIFENVEIIKFNGGI